MPCSTSAEICALDYHNGPFRCSVASLWCCTAQGLVVLLRCMLLGLPQPVQLSILDAQCYNAAVEAVSLPDMHSMRLMPTDHAVHAP